MVERKPDTKVATAERFLEEVLRDGDRPVEWIVAEATRLGICSVRTLYRAATRVVRDRYPDPSGRGRERGEFWSLERRDYGERVTGKPRGRAPAGRKGAEIELRVDPEVPLPEGSGLRAEVNPRRIVERLRAELLSRRQLNAEQMATALDVDRGTAQRLVSRRPPRVPNLELLALLHYSLAVDLNYILVGSRPTNKRLPSGIDLENAVRAYLVTTLAAKHDLSLEYVRDALKKSGELLPRLLTECERLLELRPR